MTSKKLDVADADFKKVGCGGSWIREDWIWRKLTSKKLDVVEAPGWTQRVCELLEEDAW